MVTMLGNNGATALKVKEGLLEEVTFKAKD